MNTILSKIRNRIISNEPLDRVSRHFFLLSFGTCLLLAALQAGLIIGMNAAGWSEIVLVHIVLLYWIIAAAFLTWMIRRMIRQNYEIPARKISEASKQIALGDFSVEIPLAHEDEERQDFFDETISDVNTMARELSSIETLKTDLISNVSHEMKTPLAVIKSHAELIQSPGITDDERIEYAAAIEDSAGKMAGLITNILRLNRIENQTIVPDRQEFDLCRQLTDCILAMETVWDEKDIDLEVDIDDSCRIVSDESLLELVWNNILTNAAKFTPASGKISVRQSAEYGKAIVSVTDNGIGMSEDTIRHIFDKFYQGDTSHATEGNGLGMALVHRILTLLDGDIRIESEEGRGSTITVYIPVS